MDTVTVHTPSVIEWFLLLIILTIAVVLNRFK